MTGEEGKCGGGTGTGGGAGGGNTNTNVTDNANNINANVHANVNANINVSQQNGGPEKAPVVGGTNVETLPRAGKQAMKRVSRVAPLMHPYFAYCLLLCERDFYCQQHHKLGLLNRHKLPGQYAPEGQLGPPSLENYVSSLIPLLMRRQQRYL